MARNRRPRASSGAAIEAKKNRAAAKEARLDAREARALYRIAVDAYRAKVRELRAHLKARLDEERTTRRERLDTLRADHRARRAAWLAADKQQEKDERTAIVEQYRRTLTELRGDVRTARERAKAERQAAKVRDQALRAHAARLNARKPSKTPTARERLSEALDTGRRQIETWAAQEPDAGTGAVIAWDAYGKTKQARADYARAIERLKKLHPRGAWRASDAGDYMAEQWLEGFVENLGNYQAEVFDRLESDLDECMRKGEKYLASLPSTLTQQQWEEEADRVYRRCA